MTKNNDPREKLNKYLSGDFREGITHFCFVIVDGIPVWLSQFIGEHTKEVCLFPESGRSFQYQAAYMTNHLKDSPDRKFILTRSPFIVSDFDQLAVFVVGDSTVEPPEFQTFGASINTITMCLFDKGETIGDIARRKIERILNDAKSTKDLAGIKKLIDELYTMGDSVERTLAVNVLIDYEEELEKKAL